MVKVEVIGVPLEYGMDALRSIFSIGGSIPLINVYRVRGTGAVYVIYNNDIDTESLVIKPLNNTVIGGNVVDVHVFKNRKQAAKKAKKRGGAASEGPTVDRSQGRIILRNLPYSITSVEQLIGLVLDGKDASRTDIFNLGASTVGKGFAFLQCNSAKEANAMIDKYNGCTVSERCIAIDHAINKDQFIKQRDAKRHKQQQEEQQREEQDEEKEEDGEDAESGDGDSGAAEDAAPTFDRESEASRKLFVRNVPFDTEAEQLAHIFNEEMGAGQEDDSSATPYVDRALIVRDRHTGISKGTAFLLCSSEQHAREILQHPYDIRAEGRRLIIDRSLMPGELKAVTEERKDNKGAQEDSRHLALAWVGRIDEHSEVWPSLSKSDQQKRLRAAAEKKVKLKNTNYHVSDVRLSIRNLPANVDDKQLRALYPPGKNAVKQSKIVVDKKTGKSRGFAFLQYVRHSDALRALKHINNNPSFFGPNKRPIVEFALDDMRKLHLVQKRNVAIKASIDRRKQEAEGGVTRDRERASGPSKRKQHNQMLREDDEDQKLINEHYASNKKQSTNPRNKKQKKKSKPSVEEKWVNKQSKTKAKAESAPAKKWYE